MAAMERELFGKGTDGKGTDGKGKSSDDSFGPDDSDPDYSSHLHTFSIPEDTLSLPEPPSPSVLRLQARLREVASRSPSPDLAANQSQHWH